MRLIKFRAWHEEYLTEPEAISIDGCLDLIKEGEQLILMQYTGRKDRNNQEIYEGDIVREHYHNKTFKVFWNSMGCGSWWFAERNKDGDMEHASTVNLDYLEVIGNIYENPELLEVTK